MSNKIFHDTNDTDKRHPRTLYEAFGKDAGNVLHEETEVDVDLQLDWDGVAIIVVMVLAILAASAWVRWAA